MGLDPAKLTSNFWGHINKAERKAFGRRAETRAETQHKVTTRIEIKIHLQFINFLNRHGIPYGHSATNRRSSIQIGEPDFHMKRQPDFYIEFKVPPNQLTGEQRERIAYLEKNGNTVLVITDVLDELGRSTGQAYRQACNAVREQYNLPEGLE